jgi:hypothetical protein
VCECVTGQLVWALHSFTTTTTTTPTPHHPPLTPTPPAQHHWGTTQRAEPAHCLMKCTAVGMNVFVVGLCFFVLLSRRLLRCVELGYLVAEWQSVDSLHRYDGVLQSTVHYRRPHTTFSTMPYAGGVGMSEEVGGWMGGWVGQSTKEMVWCAFQQTRMILRYTVSTATRTHSTEGASCTWQHACIIVGPPEL